MADSAAQTPKHPMQPVILDEDGIIRFKRNRIVRFLLDAGQFDMHKLALMPFEDEDWEQFAQLLGYSVSGFGELSYSSDEAVSAADVAAQELLKEQHID